MSHAGLWLTLAALGAYHGLNPAMGWLFAVSQGLQQRERRAVLRALGPIALGHELAIVLVAGAVLAAAAVVQPHALHVGAAALLLAFGVFRFARPRAHPRWTTMRVSGRELTLWSFLMSTAHGAGLMVAPLLIGLQGAESASAHEHLEIAVVAQIPLLAAAAGIALHVAAMLLVMAIVAVVVYEKLGLALLGRMWLNTDALWAGTFVVAAGITFFT
ncbi:MAG: hypothetical protein QOE31_2994 [Solirubrobacteraceae bacterium]|nr:hypothetical protein [Solirubrobacteraceae bacterium]